MFDLPDDLKRYGTCNEMSLATLDRIRELEAQLASKEEDARVGRLLRTLVDEARKRTESCGVSWGHVGLAELEEIIAEAKVGGKS